MIKKNQLALILLTLVMMLTVYFIKSPFSEDDSKEPIENVEPTTGRLQELGVKRTTLRDERANAILELDSIIAGDSYSLEEKAAALNEKKYLNSLTEKELLLELDIINKGYQDAFVHASNDDVKIIVVAGEHSVQVANEIIMMVYNNFGLEYTNVSVTFNTAQEVMGEVAS